MLDVLAIVILIAAACAVWIDLWFRLDKNFMNPVRVAVWILICSASICWALWRLVIQ